MNKFEIIADFNNHTEADLAKGLLESYGIKSIKHSDDCGGAAGGQTFIRGVQLLVSRDDLKKAKEILKFHWQDFFDLYHHIEPSAFLYSNLVMYLNRIHFHGTSNIIYANPHPLGIVGAF